MEDLKLIERKKHSFGLFSTMCYEFIDRGVLLRLRKYSNTLLTFSYGSDIMILSISNILIGDGNRTNSIYQKCSYLEGDKQCQLECV